MRRRSLPAVVSLLAAAVCAAPLEAQAPRAVAPYSVLSAEGRRFVAAAMVGDQEMLRLDELAPLLQLTVREDRAARALTVSRGTSVVVLSLDQGLASVGGKILSLTAPPARDGSRWLVPPETVSRALAPIAGVRAEVRKASRLIVLGDLRVPRITVQQEPGGPPARVAIDMAPRTAYTVVQEPKRLLVRFDADGLDLGPIDAGGGLVESVSAADPLTLAIALGKDFGTFRAATVPIDSASSRLVIELTAAGAPTLSGVARPQAAPPGQAQPPAAAAAARPEPPAAIPAAQPPGVRTIVIDPGHGGDEQGTRGAGGVLEKDLVLDVARRLRSVLDSRLGVRVLLTRDDDRIVPHDERASIANNNKADLFISLHANSSPSRSAKGAEVFYLSLDGLGAEARKMVESPEAKPVPVLGGGSRDIDLILWDMAQARHLAESAAFAMLVEEELRRRVDMSPNPVQQAPFRVLVAANMPAVLVEMGFLSNPDQEAQLASDDFKNRVVQSLFDAIVRYRGRLEAQAWGASRSAVMAVSTRILALTLITAAAVGAGTWATARYLRRPAIRPGAAAGSAPAQPGAARRIKATLDHVSADGLHLAPSERDVVYAETAPEQARRILEALLEPAPEGLSSALPPGTALRGLFVGERGDAYVDFTGTLRTNHPGGSASEILTVYAIVSALTVNLPAITSVQILIEGHEVDTLAGHVDLRRPLPNAPHWAERGST